MRGFLLIFTSMAIEALPFLLIGSIAAALVEVFVNPARLSALFRRPMLGTLAAAGGGLVFPVCECGIVPVAARLAKKGAPTSAAIAFMLAAPVLNPFVLLSTYVAFRGNWLMVILRALVALVVALLMAFLFRRERLPDLSPLMGHDHAHDHSGASKHGLGERLVHAAEHAGQEFLLMSVPFFLGAAVAALFRILVVGNIVIDHGVEVITAIPLSMGAAMLMSVCSEADAFIAAPLLSLPLSARLAFITIGPMVDIKLLLQWRRVFSPAQIFRLAVLAPLTVWSLMMLIEVSGILRGGFAL